MPLLATAMLAVFSKSWDSMSAGVIGLTVSYSLNVRDAEINKESNFPDNIHVEHVRPADK